MIVAVLLGLWVVGIEAKLVYLQIYQRADLAARAERQQERRVRHDLRVLRVRRERARGAVRALHGKLRDLDGSSAARGSGRRAARPGSERSP